MGYRPILGPVPLLLLILMASPAVARQFLEYTIKHPVYGEIGTYSNLIEPAADGGLTVTSRLDVTVTIIGITAHREHSLRHERWQDGRLVAFSSTTETITRGGRNELIRRDTGSQQANAQPATVR